MTWPSAQCTPEQRTLLEQYAALLTEENERVNLISRKDIENVWPHHIEPCLAYAVLERIRPNELIIDIGCGGGLPGIVNAVMFPEADFVLVDSTKKKIAAVQRMIDALQLPNIEVRWTRVEELLQQQSEYEHAFDRATSRSVAQLAQLVAWAQPLVKSGGTIEALKGGNLQQERSTSPYTVQAYKLPQELRQNEKLDSLVIATVQLP